MMRFRVYHASRSFSLGFYFYYGYLGRSLDIDFGPWTFRWVWGAFR